MDPMAHTSPADRSQGNLFPFALVMFELAVYFSVDMYLPAMPALQVGFCISERMTQLTLTCWLIGAGTMQVALGPVSDSLGRRPVLLSGCLVFVIASVGCALTSSLPLFLLLRTLQGCTICTALVAGYACIHERYSGVQAVKTLAWMNGVTVLAPAIGPFLGAAVLAIWPWRAIFLLLGLAALPPFLLLYRYMPETAAPRQPLSLGTALRSYWDLLRNRAMLLHLVSFCLVFSLMLSWNVSSPFLLIEQDTGDLTPFVTAQAYLYLLFIAGTRLANGWVLSKGAIRLIRTGFNLCLAGSALSLLSAVLLAGTPCSLLCFGAVTLGAGLLFPPLFRRTLELANAPMGISMAVFSSGMNIFAAAATFAAAWLRLDTLQAYFTWAFLLASAAFGLARWRILPAPLSFEKAE